MDSIDETEAFIAEFGGAFKRELFIPGIAAEDQGLYYDEVYEEYRYGFTIYIPTPEDCGDNDRRECALAGFSFSPHQFMDDDALVEYIAGVANCPHEKARERLKKVGMLA